MLIPQQFYVLGLIVERVVGESEDFFKLEHGGYIEKRGCRRY